MKKFTLLLVMVFIGERSWGQNLVPNGDFEQYVGCPTNSSQIDSALFWFKPSLGTSDYLNECATLPIISVPHNFFGFQQAHSGAAYSGLFLFTWSTADYREYIETPLDTPLVSNRCYHFQMYVSRADNFKYADDDFGVYFSSLEVSEIGNWYPLPFNPQITNFDGNYPDSTSWTLVSGDYLASGGESFLIIGNFVSDSLTDTLDVNSISNWDSYLYVDDVSLTDCEGEGIESLTKNDEIKISPNPVQNLLTINLSSPPPADGGTVVVYDVQGRKMNCDPIFTGIELQLNTEKLLPGIYLLQIINNKTGEREVGKFVKE